MQAEIISNGDELTSGKILDTNSQWLSVKLTDIGVTALYHTTVGDDLDAMIDVLRTAVERTDLIIWTGGLGPTADDLTRQAIAEGVGVPLEKNDESMRLIQEMFQRRGHEMPKANEIQAFQPRGAVPIRNPHGTAPGIDFTVQRKKPFKNGRLDFFRIMAYPGVPAEMKEMWQDSGQKSIQEMLDQLTGQKRVLRFRTIHSFGLGESQIEAMLPDIINRKHDPKVGITANRATITLRIASEAETEEECFKKIEPTATLIYKTLGDLIFGEGDDRLQEVVCRKLNTSGKTLAVIEAGTRGLLAEAIAGSKEPSDCFAGGIVLPPKQPIEPEEMIRRGRRLFNVDYLLLVGAYPPGQPDRNQTEKTFVAVVDARKTGLQKSVLVLRNYPYIGHPDIIDDLYVKRAMDLLRKTIKEPVSPK
ncbi:MAG: CinA family nicotinamide mononucleotide deamidase-related protein [Planctomycetaceae bacterium]|jgi:nicotinamide-nucleotide amidase|nr:CinA family nicotinamide mononucleotide deamidase-related protein [Planctomycetaceae bacterium]